MKMRNIKFETFNEQELCVNLDKLLKKITWQLSSGTLR